MSAEKSRAETGRHEAGRRVALAVLAASLVLLSWFPISDPDVDFHLAAGREIVARHAVPQTNIFGYINPETPWGSHQWLGSLLIYGAFRLGEATGVGGTLGLMLAKCAIVLVLFVFLYRMLRREA